VKRTGSSAPSLSFCLIGCPVLLLLVVLTCCRRRASWLDESGPVTVEELCPLSGEQMAGMDADDVRGWIRETYSTSVLGGLNDISGHSVYGFVWHVWGMTGNADIYQERLVRVTLFDIEGGPTLAQIVTGSGPPEMLRARGETIEGTPYHLGLEYPALGFSVSLFDSSGNQDVFQDGQFAVRLTEDMRVDRIDCYPPGTMEEVLRDSYLLDDDGIEYNMESTMPWPGFGELVPLYPE
jgi:hypothetical protein